MRIKGIAAEIELIRSNRRTIQLSVCGDGRVVLRVPASCTKADIDRFITNHYEAIAKHVGAMQEHRQEMEQYPAFTMEEINAMADRALQWIPERAAYYAKRMGVTFHRITIRNQKTRWGSCTAEGNLNFNCLLMEMPERVRDSVIIHELAHRRHMNHSAAFYQEVYAMMPKAEYDECHKYLKTEGAILMDRMTRRR